MDENFPDIVDRADADSFGYGMGFDDFGTDGYDFYAWIFLYKIATFEGEMHRYLTWLKS